MLAAIVLVGGADAQIVKDPPWNPDHINHLPVEIRNAVLAMCPATPDAGHYFATYSRPFNLKACDKKAADMGVFRRKC